jgi:hypothetical protein
MAFGGTAGNTSDTEADIRLAERIHRMIREQGSAEGGGRQRLFRAKAEACVESARRAKSRTEKLAFVDMADGWFQLARQQASIERLAKEAGRAH